MLTPRDGLFRNVVDLITKKNKKANIKPYMVKNHLRVFVNARINNPTFDSQVLPHLSRAINICAYCGIIGIHVGVAGILQTP